MIAFSSLKSTQVSPVWYGFNQNPQFFGEHAKDCKGKALGIVLRKLLSAEKRYCFFTQNGRRGRENGAI
jgi:hypothetical protein